MIDGIDIIKRIKGRGCLLKVHDKLHLDLTATLGRVGVRLQSYGPRQRRIDT
jgi:hypothetical protein